MVTVGRMDIPTNAQMLTLAQWFSPAFPVGGFHFSHGLEREIDDGGIQDRNALSDWIGDVLQYGSGRNDAIMLAASYRANSPKRLQDLDVIARSLSASRERLFETTQMGAAFARITGDLLNQKIGDLVMPVAVGHVARLSGLPQVATAQFYLHSLLTNLASVGMRLIPVGQTDGQRIIRDLAPLCAKIAEETAQGDLEDLGSTAFLSDIASMKHETQYSRIFRT